MSVRVVRGQGAALRRHFAKRRFDCDGTPLCVAQAAGQFHSFGATRRLLAELRATLGQQEWDAALKRHAAAAALLLPGRQARLRADQRQAYEALQARVTSHLTHNFVVQAPLFEAWATLLLDVLGQALARGPLVLLVPDLSELGWEDGALLKTLYRRRGARLPDLVLGFDPEAGECVGSDGIIWSMTAFKAASVALDMQALQAVPPLVLAATPSEEAESAPPDPRAGTANSPRAHAGTQTAWRPATLRSRRRLPALEPAADEDDLEARARRELAAAPHPLPDSVARLVADALRLAFAAFAFTSVLELGRELLRRAPRLTPVDAADVHTLVALAAHDRQFVSDNNLALAALIQEHLEAALALESRPERRAALLYRLAVVHGRRRRDPQPALACIDLALETCRDPCLEPLAAVYQEAWARNVRALALVQARRLDEARAETMRAFEQIDAVVARLPALDDGRDVPPGERDLRATHSLLAFNTRTLLDWLGADESESTAWLTRSQAAVRALPGLARFEALHWTEQYRRLGRPDLALALARRGLEAARADGDAVRAYQHGLHAAELAALLGDAPGACRCADEVQELRARCGLARLPGLDVLAALACARAALHDEAARRLQAVLADPAQRALDRRAPLLARLALVEGARGHESSAVALLDEATSLALQSGERDTLLRVAVAAARHLLRFGSRTAARRAFEQALAIADAALDGAPPAPPAEVLAALVGLVECDAATPALLERGLTTSLAALDDADVLPELERLLARLAGDARRGAHAASLARARTALAWRAPAASGPGRRAAT